MLKDKLLMNAKKTEFLIIGTRQQLKKVNISNISIGTEGIRAEKTEKTGEEFTVRHIMLSHSVNYFSSLIILYLQLYHFRTRSR